MSGTPDKATFSETHDISREETFGHPVENAPWDEIAAACGPYNCSQLLLVERYENLGLTLDLARRVGTGLAGGMWHGSTCGSLLAPIVAAGLLDMPDAIPGLVDAFKSHVGGLSCPGVLATDTSCAQCIQFGRELIDLLIEQCPERSKQISAPIPTLEMTLTRLSGDGITIIVPEGVTEIASHAAEGNVKVRNVLLPKSLRVIGEYAFANCESLLNVAFYEGLEEIRDHAFAGCPRLKSQELASCGATIGEGAFEGCA
jgi:hypothetical protein